MKKSEILECSERLEPVSYEFIHQHRKQLRALYSGNAVFIPTIITNAIQAGIITHADEYYETVEAIIEAMELDDDEVQDERENLHFHTVTL